ncbi:transposable element tc3 transposase [Trichonephila clavipes]|nr:transposable element tc3 transposase [Trichonephila clavipes]
MEVDDTWPWKMQWSDEAHFYLDGAVNTQNCRIWGSSPPNILHQQPLHSDDVTAWCGFTAEFILGSFFFETLTP